MTDELKPAPLYQQSEADRAELAAMIAWRSSSPEAEHLYRLFSAVEHYRRMGWLQLPDHEVWKYDDVISGARRVIWPEPRRTATLDDLPDTPNAK